MESKKTEFQSFLTTCEKKFEEFVNAHYQSFGEIFRSQLPVLMILWGIVLFLDTYNKEYSNTITTFIISPMLTIFGLVVYAREYHGMGNGASWDWRLTISEGRMKFANYPDVIQYLEQLQSAIETENERDKKLTKITKIVFWAPLALYSIKALYHFFVAENALNF